MGESEDLAAALAATRAEFEEFRYILPDALVEIDYATLRVTYLNRMAMVLLGYGEADVAAGINAFALLDPPSQVVVARVAAEHRARSVDIGKPYERESSQALYELTLIRKDGTMFPAEVQGSYVLDESGRPLRVRYMARDISARKKAEEELRESERRLTMALDATGLGIWEIDVPRRAFHIIRWFNSPLSVPVDGSVEDLTATVHEADRADLRRKLDELMAGERDLFREEIRVHRESGEIVWVVSRATVSERDADGQPLRVVGTSLDITRRKEAEQERQRAEELVRDAQRLESIGTLAAGIAHDFNNLLTVITGDLYLLEPFVQGNADAAECLEEARVATQRGAEVAARLLQYARPTTADQTVVHLDALVEETLRLGRTRENERVAVSFEACGGDDRVLGNRTALQQALLNLVINALDAMGGSGRLVLRRRTREVTADDDLGRRGLKPGTYHELSVSDSGPGIPAAARSRVFEPFFTTKEVGKGTGLGLWSALGVARAHGGWLDVESEEGEGATFFLTLPRYEDR